jgi:O-antigen/teichoic acid export membrane protein
MTTGANTGSQPPTSNSRTIVKSATWSGIDTIFSIFVIFVTSIGIARIIGKDAIGQAQLGSYQYIVYLTTITLTVGSFGLPSTTLKYMAEYLNKGQPEVARATYLATLKLQSFLSLFVAAIGFGVVSWLADPGYFWPSLLLVGAIVPRLISSVPSQANNAAETVRRNTIPSMAGAAVIAIVTFLSLWRGWEFTGLAAALFAGSSLECILKLRAVELWLGDVPRGAVPPELRRRMVNYSGKGLALLILYLVVWDRSDLLILRRLNPDTRQVLYFTLPFSLTDRALLIPALFAGALSITITAQYGRGQARLKEMTVDGGRYALMMALPLLLGLACISEPLVLLVYKAPYRAMIPTLAAIALLAIPKSLVSAPTTLLQTTERQGFLIFWTCVCGAVDIGLDFLLVGKHGAFGAAIANGTAQTLAAIGIWTYVWRSDGLNLKMGYVARILVCGAVMAAGVLAIRNVLPGAAGLALSVATGAVLWFVSLRLTRALTGEDVSRFLSVGGQLPASIRPHWKRLVGWLAPAVALD